MRRCLIVIQNLTNSGSPHTFLHVIDVLKKKGFDIDVFVYAVRNKSFDLRLLDIYKKATKSIYFSNINMNGFCYKVFPVLLFLKKCKQIRKQNYDLIFTNDKYFASTFLCTSKSKSNTKVYYYALGNMNIKSKHMLINKKESFINKKLRFLDAYISLSSFSVLANNKVPKNRSYMLMDYPDNYYPNLIKEVKKTNKIVLGQIGYYCKNKNQLFSINLLEQLILSNVDVKLLFIGYQSSEEPEYINKLEQTIKSKRLETRVEFLPSDYDKEEFFKKIDLLLQPSFNEGLSLVLLEAQFSNTYCIASNNVPCDVEFGLCDRLPLNVELWKNKILNSFTVIGKKPTSIYDKTVFESKLFKILDSDF